MNQPLTNRKHVHPSVYIFVKMWRIYMVHRMLPYIYICIDSLKYTYTYMCVKYHNPYKNKLVWTKLSNCKEEMTF